ncbi:unnamed protein product [Caenorhabditis angaria]|uniref:Receptor expression-enhancing protein n=1 Tax=Caenorhabditis angaria TaxID=860376 RepID=A0A9P1N0G0_9PELO|nr:unnamed protein product [Caenorhabditis angaria]
MQFSLSQIETRIAYYLNPQAANRAEGGKEGNEENEIEKIENWKEKIWQNAEGLSGMKRERLTVYAVGFTVFYVIFGSVLAMLSHVICTFLPVLQSLKHIRKSPNNQKNAENLLLYWIVFAVFTIFDFLPIASIPIYFFVKSAFFFHLYHPSSNAIEQVGPYIDTFFKLLESMWIQSSNQEEEEVLIKNSESLLAITENSEIEDESKEHNC